MNPIKLIILLLNSLTALACAAEDCRSLDAKFQAQMQKPDMDAARVTLFAMQEACPLSIPDSDEIYYSTVLAEQAKALADKGKPKEASALLDKGFHSWALSDMRGHLASQQALPNWGEVARHYAFALEQVTDPANPAQLTADEVKRESRRLVKLAVAAELRFGKPAPAPRDNKLHGVLLTAQRGFGGNRIPRPAYFDTDRYEMNGDNTQSADEMLLFVQTQKPAKLALTGHADPRGTPEHNLELSRRRAQSLADYLVSKGANLPIKVKGEGEEAAPPDSDQPSTREEEWQFSRRVDIGFGE